MTITSIDIQAKNKDRVNVHVDGKYRFSLDIFQIGELGVRVGRDYSEAELEAIERESVFGKVYGRALVWSLGRPHSERETRDYLYRTSRPKRRKDGSLSEGVASDVNDRVFERLVEKGYINDQNFVRFWVENRNLTKGASRRKLEAELSAKGIGRELVAQALAGSGRSDDDELRKVIAKKAARYADEQKLVAYLLRQGFAYDDVKRALAHTDADG